MEREGRVARRRRWTAKKRKRARQKAHAALRERRRIIELSRDRQESGYAGMVPVLQFSREVLKLPQGLPEALKMKKGRTAVYTPVDEAMAYLGCQMAGIVRLNHMDRLLPEGALAEALGIPQWMSENTEQRFLKRATEESLDGVDQLIQRRVQDEELQWSGGWIEVDGDVTGVPQRARRREGVRPGYCGGKVVPCYQQPRVTVNGLVWWTDLRPGDDGGVDLFGRTRQTALKLAQKHPKREVVYRLDGYFSSKESLRQSVAEDCPRNLHFLLVIHDTRMKPGHWEALAAGSPGRWKRMNSTTEIKELGSVRPWEEAPPVRAVAVRRQKRDLKKKRRRSPPEWDLKYLIVTDLPRATMGTGEVFRRYHQRQREEFSFKDGKQSLATAKMPTQSLTANRMHVKMVGLAQVILKLFAEKFLPHPGRYGPTCKTIREKVIVVGGKNQAGGGPGGLGADVLRVPLAAAYGQAGPR